MLLIDRFSVEQMSSSPASTAVMKRETSLGLSKIRISAQLVGSGRVCVESEFSRIVTDTVAVCRLVTS